jgi:FemAB-related protein (PEP-CTERM system-associated)
VKIIIRDYNISDESRWNDYVDHHPEGTIFHRISWKKSIEQSFGHKSYYLIAEKLDGTISGIFPLFRLKSYLFGDYLISVPFAELGGVLADDEDAATSLFEFATNITRELNSSYLEIRSRTALPGLKVKSLYYNFSREIFPELEANMLAIPRKSRAAVRQGIKCGLIAEYGNHLFDQFYEILARNYQDLGTPVFPRCFFLNLLVNHGDSAQIMVVKTKEGEPTATIFTFFYRDRVIPYYAGSLNEFRKLSPNDFKYWELMKYGCENGYRVFDFGRSKEGAGSFDFKRHWGFEPEPLAYQYYLNGIAELPNLSPTNPSYARKIEMWKKLPFFATKIIGPLVARYLA